MSHYCKQGTSVALPFDVGSWSVATDLSSQAPGCSACPARDHACASGCTEPQLCPRAYLPDYQLVLGL